MGVDEVQAAYDDALRRVLADLARTTDIAPLVRVDFTEPELQYAYGTTHQSALRGTDDVEVAAADLADRVQEDVLEELWGPAWPVCPGHSHPAAAKVDRDVAVWTCPKDGRTIARIGDLETAR